jgi:hypothetical protein
MEGALVTKVTSRASDSRSVANSQLRLIAAGLRRKIIWILTPTEYTRKDFIDGLREFLKDFALGKWDSLVDRDVALATSVSSGVTSRILRIGQSLAIGVSPYLLITFYERFRHPLTQPLQDYANLLSVVWLGVCILSEIDPRWSERVGGFKEAVSIVTRR